jgi:hypothetical protein
MSFSDALHQPLLDGLGYSLGFGVDLELFVDVADVVANGIETDEELLSDDHIVKSLDEKLKDLSFAVRE